MTTEVSQRDLDFLQDLIAQTQSHKVDWKPSRNGSYLLLRSRAAGVLSRTSDEKPRIRLQVLRRNDAEPSRILEQRIDEAAPLQRDLLLNSLLSYLFQLATQGSADADGRDIYDDLLDEGDHAG